MSPKEIYMLVEPSFMVPVWYSRSIEGLKRRATLHKRSLIEVQSVDQITGDDVRAIVIVSTNDDWTRDILRQLRHREMYPILIGTEPNKFGEDVSGTRYSSHSSIEALLYYFQHCGRRRIALVGINANASNDTSKRDAFLSAAEMLQLPVGQSNIYYKEPSNLPSTQQFLEHVLQYDGVICSNDYIAMYVMNVAARRGVKIPEDLYVAGLGNIMLCQYATPSLTSATRFYYETGEQVYDIWDQLNENPSITSIVSTVRYRIIVRGSTAFSPLPEIPNIISAKRNDTSREQDDTGAAVRSIRALENCLSQCDKLDMEIVHGLLHDISHETLAEQLYISSGTVRYRLKKIYAAANVETKSEFLALFCQYIQDSKVFQRFSEDDGI